jgi:DNA-binding CsgD family transcriptional regulator
MEISTQVRRSRPSNQSAPRPVAEIPRGDPINVLPTIHGRHTAGDIVSSLLALGLPVAVFDQDGQHRFVSSPAAQLLGECTAELELACRGFARSLSLRRDETGASRSYTVASKTCRLGSQRVSLLSLPPGDAAQSIVALVWSEREAAPASPEVLSALTHREREVATLVSTGSSAKEIAHALRISIHTVRRHTERVFAKMGVTTRTQLAVLVHPWDHRS